MADFSDVSVRALNGFGGDASAAPDVRARSSMFGGDAATRAMGLSAPQNMPTDNHISQLSGQVAAQHAAAMQAIQSMFTGQQEAPQPMVAYNGSNILAGNQAVPLDNLTASGNAIDSGAAVHQGDTAPPGHYLMPAAQLRQYIQQQADQRGVGHVITESGKQAVMGLRSGLGMVPRALAAVTPAGSSVNAGLNHAADWVSGSDNPGNIPDTAGHGVAGASMISAANVGGMLAPNLAADMLAVAQPEFAPVAAGMNTGLLAAMGGSTYEEKFNEGKSKGMSDMDARTYAGIHAGINTAGLAAIGKVAHAVSGTAGRIVGPEVEQAVAQATDPRWGKIAASQIGRNAVADAGIFGTQNAAGTSVDNAYGTSDASPWEEGAKGALTGLFMTPFMAPKFAFEERHAGQMRGVLGQQLQSGTPTNMLAAADIVRHNIEPAVGADQAHRWNTNFSRDVMERQEGAIDPSEAYGMEAPYVPTPPAYPADPTKFQGTYEGTVGGGQGVGQATGDMGYPGKTTIDKKGAGWKDEKPGWGAPPPPPTIGLEGVQTTLPGGGEGLIGAGATGDLGYPSKRPKLPKDEQRANANVAGDNPGFETPEQTLQRKAAEAAAKKVEAAAKETDTAPTEGQIEAGNYKKGQVSIQGLNISIENPKGSTRSGTDADGNTWETTMQHHYGYIKGTVGKDKDHIDVFLGDDAATADHVWVVDQKNKEGGFDEHKVMIGPKSEEEARQAYRSNYEAGWQGDGAITRMSMDDFKKWVKDKRATKKPVAYEEPKREVAPEYSKVPDKYKPMARDFMGLDEAGNRIGGAGTMSFRQLGEKYKMSGETIRKALKRAGFTEEYRKSVLDRELAETHAEADDVPVDLEVHDEDAGTSVKLSDEAVLHGEQGKSDNPGVGVINSPNGSQGDVGVGHGWQALASKNVPLASKSKEGKHLWSDDQLQEAYIFLAQDREANKQMLRKIEGEIRRRIAEGGKATGAQVFWEDHFPDTRWHDDAVGETDGETAKPNGLGAKMRKKVEDIYAKMEKGDLDEDEALSQMKRLAESVEMGTSYSEGRDDAAGKAGNNEVSVAHAEHDRVAKELGLGEVLDHMGGDVRISDDTTVTGAVLVPNEHGGFDVELSPHETDSWEVEHHVRHENGHRLDGSAWQVFSSNPAMLLEKLGKFIMPRGEVAQELVRLYRTDPFFKRFFSYPLDQRWSGRFDADDIQSELFANAFALYAHPDYRAILEAQAPKTHAFIKGAVDYARANPDVYAEIRRSINESKDRQGDSGEGAQEGRSEGVRAEQGATGRDTDVPEVKRSEKLEGFSDGAVQATIERLPENQRETATKAVEAVKSFGEKWLGGAFLGDIVDAGEKYARALRTYYDAKKKQGAMFYKLNEWVNHHSLDYAKLSRADRAAADAAIDFMDKNKKWGFDPKISKDYKVDIDPEAKAKFDALSKEAKKVVQDHFKLGHDMMSALKLGLIDRAKATLDEVKAAGAKDAELEKAEKAYHDTVNDISHDFPEAAGPYSPQVRTGDWFAVAKSSQYAAAEAAYKEHQTKENKAALDALRQDGKHYFVTKGDRGDMVVLQNRLRAHTDFLGDNVDKRVNAFPAEQFSRNHEAPFAQIEKLKAILENAKPDDLDAKTRNLAIKGLDELYLKSLSDLSARHATQKREGIAGYRTDRVAASIDHFRAQAHLASLLNNSGAVHKALADIRTQAHEGYYINEAGEKVQLEGDQATRKKYANEVLLRHALNMIPMDNKVQNKLLQVTAGMKIVTSPGFYLQQFTEPFMVMLPVLAGSHGYSRSLSAMWGAQREARSLIKVLTGRDAFDPEKYASPNGPAETARIKEMLHYLTERGRIDLGQLSDLGGFEAGNFSTAFKKAYGMFNRVATNMEAVNRLTSSITAYRLSYDKNLHESLAKGMDRAAAEKDAHSKALGQSDHLVRITHGEYDAFAAPRYLMQQNWPGLPVKLMTQFKKFQIMELSLMARLAHQSFAGATPEERKIGRAMLGYTFGQYGVLTGLMGLPGYGVASTLIDWLFKDKDEPLNPDKHLRTFLAEHMGNEMAELLTHGVPGAAGAPVTSRIGAGGMFTMVPLEDVNVTDHSHMAEMALAMMGPFAGMVSNDLVGAVAKIRQGDYYKGIEQTMPTALRNAMRAYRMNTEGLTNSRNDVLLKPEDMTFLDKNLQALGFNTSRMDLRQMLQSGMYTEQEYFKTRMDRLSHEYAKAARERDTDTMASLRQRWQDYQAQQKELGMLPTPIGDLLKAPGQQLRREVKTTDGIQWNRSNRTEIQQLQSLGG